MGAVAHPITVASFECFTPLSTSRPDSRAIPVALSGRRDEQYDTSG